MQLRHVERRAVYDFGRADATALPDWAYRRMLDAPREAVLLVPPERPARLSAWMARRRPDLRIRARGRT